ncbi:hypothetical protein KUTeg_011371 [Tegillarca granosa]|uniref:C1q domain-containing protein n=1 Tax=Tegillarca granosa TaxID=220873 RepID=A0ABQ9F108_TEGGR|nr:hypothetical protein KUTeg_011371 [Tegillarca granosa]
MLQQIVRFQAMLNLKTIFLVCFSVASINGGCITPMVSGKNVLLNEGKGYNSAIGEFTAPTDGVYVFSWTILTKETQAIAADLYLGSSRKARLFADARGVINVRTPFNERIIQIKIRSMRDNLLFSGIKPEFTKREEGVENEDTEVVLQKFLKRRWIYRNQCHLNVLYDPENESNRYVYDDDDDYNPKFDRNDVRHRATKI